MYRGRDLRLGRNVALKFLASRLATDSQALERFRREVRAGSRVSHAHICTVYDVGEDEQGQPFLVMELLDGQNLRDVLASGPVSLHQLIDWSEQIADALDAAHAAGIIHRDIKPANIFISARGGAKILDFGVARLIARARTGPNDDDSTESIYRETEPRFAVGTVSYMSPEQVRGDPLDQRTDLFSVGAVMYEMAAGRRAFTGTNDDAVRSEILNRDPPLIVRRDGPLPGELARIISKAMDKNRDFRYQTGADLCADLRRARQEMATGTGQRAAHRTVARWQIPVLACAVVLAIAGVIVWLTFRQHSDRGPSELVPVRLTSNPPDNPVQSIALSRDGKYLAYSDLDGIHLRAVDTAATRLVPDSRNISPLYWSSDGADLYGTRNASDPAIFYRINLLESRPNPIGTAAPSPDEQYELAYTSGQLRFRRAGSRSSHAMNERGTDLIAFAFAPDADRIAAILMSPQMTFSIRTTDLASGHQTTVVEPQSQYIDALAWLSSQTVGWAQGEGELGVSGVSLWKLAVDPKTGKPSGKPRRRAQWSDFFIEQMQGGGAESPRLCFLRDNLQFSVYTAALQPGETSITDVRRLTDDESNNLPAAWTQDSKAVIFYSDRDGPMHVFSQEVGTRTASRIGAGRGAEYSPRLSPDTKWLFYLTYDGIPYASSAHLMRTPVMPQVGEDVQEVATGYINHVECSRVADGLCAIQESRGTKEVIYLLDPSRGRRAEILETSGDSSAVISPDGRQIAYFPAASPRNQIRIIDTQGHLSREIDVNRARNLSHLQWSTGGTGFFCSDTGSAMAPGGLGVTSRLIHVAWDGASQVVWTQSPGNTTWGIPSPDGRRLAIFGAAGNANVWMVNEP